jgi:hypothetical protein
MPLNPPCAGTARAVQHSQGQGLSSLAAVALAPHHLTDMTLLYLCMA